MYGVQGDPIDDSQAGAADTDIVGNASHGSLYTLFDDNGTVTTADDTLLFRMRIGNPTSPTNFAGVGIVGMDANLDGKIDLFMAVDGRNNTQATLLLDPGTGANISPSTTTTSLLPSGWLANNGIYGFNSTNYLVAGVDSTNDPHWNSDNDLDDDGKQDAFVTWRVSMPDLATVMAKPSPADRSGAYGPRGATGIAGYDKNTTVQYVNFTQTQHGPINGDLNGVGSSYDKNASFSSLGAFTAPMSAANPVSASDKVTITKPVDANGYINAAEDDAFTVSGTATANGWVKLTISDTDGGTADVVVWVQATGAGTWSATGLNLTGLAEGTLTFTADIVTANGGSTIVSGATGDTTTAIHDTIPPVIGVAALATAGSPVINGTSTDIPAGSAITVSIDPNGDGNLSDLVTFTALVGAGGAWSVDTSSVAPSSGTMSGSGFTAYAKVSATGSDAAGNSATAVAITKPTVPAQITNDTTPAITGTWGGTNSGTDTLAVTVNGVAYTTAGGQLVISGNAWTLTIPNGNDLSNAASPYSVTATTTRGGTSVDDPTATELQIVNGPAIAITSSNSQSNPKPTISGTSTIISGFITLVIDPNNDGNLADAVTYSVATDGSGNWSLNTGSTMPLSGTYPLAGIIGTMGITATATDGNGARATATQSLTVTVRSLSLTSITATAVEDTTGTINNADTVINRREDDAITVSGSSSNAVGLTVTVTALDNDSGTTNPSGTATIQADGSWSVTGLNLSALRDGYLTFSATITGASASNTAYTHDATVPQIRFTTPSTIDKNGGVAGGAITGSSDLVAGTVITLTLSSGGSGTATAAANGDWSYTHPSTSSGSSIDVTATPAITGTDSAGNKPAAAISATFPTSASITLTANAIVIGTIAGDNVIVDSEAAAVVISGTSTLANGTTVSVNIAKADGTAIAGPITTTVSGGTWTIAAQNLSSVTPNGTLVVTASATSTYTYTDVALPVLQLGTVGSGSPPTVTITSAGDANLSASEDDAVTISGTTTNVSNGGTVTLTVSDTDAGTSHVVGTATVSGGTWTTTTTLNLSSLAEGTLTIGASVTASSQTATDSTVINHDTIPPLLTITAGPTASDATPLITGTADLSAGATITIAIDADANGSTDVTFTAIVQSNGTWSVDTGAATPGSGTWPASGLTTTSKVTASGADPAGNSTSIIATTIISIANDTGVNSQDFLTNDPTLIFTGKAEPGSSVVVKIDGATIGTTTTNGSGVWTYDHTGTSLAAATYSLTAVATKSAGVTATATQAFTVDLSGPAVAITSITDDTGTAGDFRTKDPQLVFNGTAATGSSVLVTLRDSTNAVVFSATVSPTGGNWSVDRTSSTLPDGTYTLTAVASDAAGNSTSTNQAVVVDTTAVIAITTNASTSDDTPLITGTTDIEAGRTITIEIDPNNDGNYADAQTYTATVQLGGTWSVVATTPLSGTVGLRATGTDSNGNAAAATKPLTINLNSPTITITEPIGDGDLDGTEDDAVVIMGSSTFIPLGAQIHVIISDGSSIFDIATVEFDGSWELEPLNLSAMANGVITITATYTDDTGTSYTDTATVLHNKTGAVSIDSITVDTGALSDFITSDNTLIFYGSADANDSVLLTLTGSSGTVFTTTVTATSGGAWTYNYTGTVLPDGTYTLQANTASQVVVVDTSVPAGPVTVVSQSTSDTTPVITGTATVGTGESLTVSVNGVTYSTGEGHLVLTGSNWTLTIPAANSLSPASVGVGFDGVYDVTATIKDVAGNALSDSTSDELTIADTTAPVVDLAPANAGTINYSSTSDGSAVSLDNGADPATVVEASDQITYMNLAVAGFVDGATETLSFGGTTVAANGSSGTQSDITVGGVRINLTYAGGVFSVQKFNFTDLTAAEAQAIVRDIQYAHSGAITAGVRTVSFTATDAAGNVSAAATATITVTSPNATPVVDLNGAGAGVANAVTWTELVNTAHVAASIAASGAFTDSDNTNLTQMLLTVSGAVDGNSETLAIGGTAFPLGTTVTNSDIGAFLVSYNSSTGVFTLTPDGASVALLTDFQTLLRGITYNNTTDNPTAGDRLVAVRVTDAGNNNASDGGNAQSLAATSTITVAPANDQPVITGLAAASFSEHALNAAAAVIDSDVTLTDSDSSNYSGGSLTISGLIAAQDVVSLPTGSAAVTGNVRANGSNVEYYDGAAWTVVGAFSGGNGADFTVSLNASATGAIVERIIEHLRFANSSTAPSTARTLTVAANDGDGNPVQNATVAITIVRDNDAPVISATSLDITYAEQAAATALVGGTISVTDPDGNANFYNSGSNVGSLTVSLDGYVSGDTLTVADVGTGAGQIGVSGSSISYGGVTFATMAGGGAADLVITFNSNTATPAALQGLLAQLRFNSTNADATVNGTDPSRLYTVTLNDGANTRDASSTSTALTGSLFGLIEITADNSRPVVTAGATLAYTEQDPAAAIDNTITLTDADDTQLTSARVTISSGKTAGDILAVASQNGITGSYDSGTGVLTMTGTATLAHYRTALRSVTFNSTSDNPTAISASRTISWDVTDANSDLAGAQTSSAGVTSTILVTPINDAPVNTLLATLSVYENATLSFTGLRTISVDDPDLDLASSQVTVTQGSLTVSVAGGATISAGASGTTTATLTGTQTQINAALATLVYTPTAHYNGPALLTVVSTDSGTPVLSDTDSIAITVDPVNSAPSGIDGSFSAAPDSSSTMAAVNFSFTDANDSPANALNRVKITTLPDHGTLTNNGIPVSAGAFVTVANINAGLLVYTPVAGESGTPYASFTFQIEDDGGTANGGVNLDASANTLVINVGGTDPQHICFCAPTKASRYSTVTLSATASSGLPVTFAVTSGPGSIAGNILTFSAAGSVVVTASQAGNGTYSAAPDKIETIQVVDFYIPSSVADGWTITYGGEDDLLVRRDSSARALAMHVVGNYAVSVAATGTTTNAAGNTDIYTAKYDAATGEKLWEVIHAGEAAGADEGNAIAMDSLGNVWIVGVITNSDKNTDIYAAKYASADGALVWEKTFKGVTGSLDYGNDGPGGYAAAAPYQGGDNRRSALAVAADGSVLITGYVTNAAKKMDAITLKYDASGNLAWAKTFNGPSSGTDYGHAVAVNSAGDVFVAGCSINTTPDVILLKYSGTDGTALWSKRYDGGKPDSAISMKLDSDGHPVISGYSQRATFDFLTARYDSADGTLIWMDLRDGPAHSSDSAWDFALVDGTEPTVTGTSYPQNGVFDGYTFRYNCPCSTNPVAWAKRYEGPSRNLDQFLSIGLDMFSNPVVTGYSQNSDGTYDTQTVKYAAADGTVLWQKRHDGPGNGDDFPRHVVVDPAGNVFVAGISTSADGTLDSWVTRYVATEPSTTAAQVITFLTPPTQGIGVPLTLAATASSGLPVQYSVLSGPATLDNGVLSFTGAGSVTVRASQPGNGTYLAAANVDRTFSVVKSRQIIVFNLAATAKATDSITLAAMASSELPIAYTILSGPAELDGASLTFTDAGTVTIQASQAGNTEFDPAVSVVRSITVTKAAQTLTFTLPVSALAPTSVTLNGVVTSGLPVQYSIISGPGSITSGVLTFTGDGVVVVRASQPGNELFEPSASLNRSIKVSKASQTIAFPGPVSLPNIDSLPLTPSATSGLPVSMSVVSGPGVITSGVLSFTAPGRVIIRATQAGDAHHFAARDVVKTITATVVRPVLSPITLPTAVVSQTILQNITASRNPTSYTATGLPPGVTLNPRTGLLSGKPTTARMVEGELVPYEVVFKAANSAGYSDPVTVLWTITGLPPEVIGTFNGLVDRTEDLSLNSTQTFTGLGGSINVVTTSTGAYTGKLLIETVAYAFSGKLEFFAGTNPSGTSAIKRTTGSLGLLVNFAINLSTGELTGTVTDGVVEDPPAVHAWRSQWHATNRPATLLEGTYNAALEPSGDLLGNHEYPQGNGFGSLKVTTAGLATWSGKLADGTAVTAATTVGPLGQIALHIPLYTPTTVTTAGAANGWLQVEGNESTLNGALTWKKNPQASTSTTRSYKNGFLSHPVAVLGNKYLGTPITLPPSDGANAHDGAVITFADGGLEHAAFAEATDGELRQAFRLVNGRTVLMPTGLINNPATVKLSLNANSGVFSGTFLLKDADPTDTVPPIGVITRVVTYTGVMVPRLNQGVGYFVLPQLPTLEPLTTINTSPQFSGQVLLEVDQ